MSTANVGYRPRPLGLIDACRVLADRVSAFIEVNRSGLRALQRLASVPAQLVQLQLRICAVAMQLINIPLSIAQCSFQLLGLLQYCFAPTHVSSSTGNDDSNRHLSITASANNIMLIMRSITSALQIPLKLIVLPIAMLEASFRIFNRQPASTSTTATTIRGSPGAKMSHSRQLQ